MKKSIDIISYCCDLAANIRGSSKGPETIRKYCDFSELDVNWLPEVLPDSNAESFELVAKLSQKIALQVQAACQQQHYFLTLGGDHSSAIGTWQGAAASLNGPLGLIWIDAHLDAHTPDSSLTGNIHGMPVATLLGHGDKRLTHLLQQAPTLLPENLVLIGIRSYEVAEFELLKKRKVKIFTDMDVIHLGMDNIFEQTLRIATQGTAGFGISIDLDGFTPEAAPGVSTPENGGLVPTKIYPLLRMLKQHQHFLGAEIVEFNPLHDHNDKTSKICCRLIKNIFQ